MPRVSIILPNYNYARFLSERFRTIIGQTLDNFELIYVDDGSTDQSNMIAAEHGCDPRLSMHLHRENSGRVYRRWNEGAALATGDWLWFAGADDVSHPRFLERSVDLVSARQAVSIVHSGRELIDAGAASSNRPVFNPGWRPASVPGRTRSSSSRATTPSAVRASPCGAMCSRHAGVR